MSGPEEKARKYIDMVEASLSILSETKIVLSEEKRFVVDTAERYVKDARYYLDRGDSAVALASVSYAEGLLDALRFLKIVDFQWPEKGTSRDA